MEAKGRAVLWPLSAVAAALVAYAGSLRAPFVYDDTLTVLENPSIRSLGSLWVLQFQRFRPVVNLSYAVDYAFWGPTPLGFHATGLLLHAAVVGLLYLLAQRLFADAGSSPAASRRWAWAVSLGFAVHPLLSEAVIYVSARSELLCALFCLASLLCLRRALRGGERGSAVAGFALWLLALGSKESAAGLPLVVVGLDALLGGRVSPGASRHRRLGVHAALWAVLLLGGGVRLASFFAQEQGGVMGAWRNLAEQSGVWLRYLGLFFVPLGQTLMHAVEPVGAVAARLAIAGGAVAVLGWLLFRCRARAPLLVLGAAWFAAFLAPSSSFVALNEPMSEHRVYLASAGLWLASVAALAWALERGEADWGRRWFPLGMGATAAVLAALTFARGSVWASEERLWAEAAERSPRVWAARYAFADVLRTNGKCDAAVAEYRAAVALVPREARAHNNLGICLAQLKRYAEAEEAFERAAALDPKPSTLRNLGRLAQLRGDTERAQRHFARASELESRETQPGRVPP